MATHFARIERDHPNSLVVIDDPSDMLDAETRKRFVSSGLNKLLHKTPEETRQVVVLTHDDQLVRELWNQYHELDPAITQDAIQMQSEDSETVPTSVFVPRNLQGALERVQILLENDFEKHRDRLWFRAALSAQTRVCLEMYAKQVAQLLGPVGLQQMDSIDEATTLGDISPRVIKSLNKMVETACGKKRHNGAKILVSRIKDLLSHSSYEFLNPGSHADVILPEISASKRVVEQLEKAAEHMKSQEGNFRDDWLTDSHYALTFSSLLACAQPCA